MDRWREDGAARMVRMTVAIGLAVRMTMAIGIWVSWMPMAIGAPALPMASGAVAHWMAMAVWPRGCQ